MSSTTAWMTVADRLRAVEPGDDPVDALEHVDAFAAACGQARRARLGVGRRPGRRSAIPAEARSVTMKPIANSSATWCTETGRRRRPGQCATGSRARCRSRWPPRSDSPASSPRRPSPAGSAGRPAGAGAWRRRRARQPRIATTTTSGPSTQPDGARSADPRRGRTPGDEREDDRRRGREHHDAVEVAAGRIEARRDQRRAATIVVRVIAAQRSSATPRSRSQSARAMRLVTDGSFWTDRVRPGQPASGVAEPPGMEVDIAASAWAVHACAAVTRRGLSRRRHSA